jgi:uncharacterized protein
MTSGPCPAVGFGRFLYDYTPMVHSITMRRSESSVGIDPRSGSTSANGAQAAVIAFLSSPQAYPGGVERVARIDTHAAIVFLAGDRAYKLKRSVKLPYLDFSTVEKRRAVIERELEINSRVSPELYLSVLPVTAAPGSDSYQLGGSGEAADWVLVMRRFEEDALLNARAANGLLDRELALDLASTVEHLHRQATPVKNAGFFGILETIVADLETALCGSDALAQGLSLKPYIERLRHELAAQRPLIEERERENFVRRCHGDLHIRNIVMWEGKPRLFDAIEFDDRLATIDVLYDLAFLLMDLWHRGLKGEANAVLNHYLQGAAIAELQGLALLPLFLSLRSAIRAMTGLHALAFRHDSEREASLSEIESYGAFAANLLEAGQPRLVAIGGLSGTGKSSAAREIAPLIGRTLGALHLRTDVERKIMRGISLANRLPADSYTAENRDEVYRRVFKRAEVALDCGQSVVVDAVFPENSKRSQLRDLAQRTNAAFEGFWLEADATQIRERAAARSAEASDAGAAVVEKQLETVLPPPDWIKIDASGTVAATVAAIARELCASGGTS